MLSSSESFEATLPLLRIDGACLLLKLIRLELLVGLAIILEGRPIALLGRRGDDVLGDEGGFIVITVVKSLGLTLLPSNVEKQSGSARVPAPGVAFVLLQS